VGKTDHKSQIGKCAVLAAELNEAGAVIIDKLSVGERPELPAVEINEFNRKFDVLQKLLDSLKVLDDKGRESLPLDERSVVSKVLPPLIDSLQALVATNEQIVQAVRRQTEHTSERLAAIRKARDIFEKFVRKPAGEESRFYDKRG
jgi:hypothetical protein